MFGLLKDFLKSLLHTLAPLFLKLLTFYFPHGDVPSKVFYVPGPGVDLLYFSDNLGPNLLDLGGSIMHVNELWKLLINYLPCLSVALLATYVPGPGDLWYDYLCVKSAVFGRNEYAKVVVPVFFK